MGRSSARLACYRTRPKCAIESGKLGRRCKQGEIDTRREVVTLRAPSIRSKIYNMSARELCFLLCPIRFSLLWCSPQQGIEHDFRWLHCVEFASPFRVQESFASKRHVGA